MFYIRQVFEPTAGSLIGKEMLEVDEVYRHVIQRVHNPPRGQRPQKVFEVGWKQGRTHK